MVRTQIQLTEEQIGELRGIAAADHVSIAHLIREAVDGIIASRHDRSRGALALSVVGRYASGFTQTSLDHDQVAFEP